MSDFARPPMCFIFFVENCHKRGTSSKYIQKRHIETSETRRQRYQRDMFNEAKNGPVNLGVRGGTCARP